ncbi:MAG TPA: hypothetical protein VG125_07060 [Pirellulales bacterium]|nr:hypothetical protein [Pirellulales bacterium]
MPRWTQQSRLRHEVYAENAFTVYFLFPASGEMWFGDEGSL